MATDIPIPLETGALSETITVEGTAPLLESQTSSIGQVVTNDFDPEYGESLGARIALVTQSGGNTLEVNIQGNYSNGNWSPKTDERWAADGVPLAPSGFDSSAETGQISAVVSGSPGKETFEAQTPR